MPSSFESDDIYRYQEVKELQCDSQGRIAACELSQPDRASNGNQTFIWLLTLDGSKEPLQLTYSGSDSSPRFRPKEHALTFLSSRGGGRQVYLLPLTGGGEARRLTDIPSGIMSFEWAPDGGHLLAICTMTVDPELRGDTASGGGDGASRPADAPHVVWRLPYKLDGVGYTLDSEIHLFCVEAATGEATQLTKGPFEVDSADWSPDCERIAFTRTREGRTAHRSDLWIVDRTGENARRVTEKVATCSYPRWSPDGRYIVFTGSLQEGDAQMRLWLHDVTSGQTCGLGDEDIEVVSGSTVFWTQDSSKVLFVQARNGRQEITAISIPDGELTRVVKGDRQVDAFCMHASGLVYAIEDGTSPKDVWVCSLDGAGERKLTDFNPWWRDKTDTEIVMRRFEVPDGDGGTEFVDGWIFGAKNRDMSGPLLVDAHGGPSSYTLLSFNWHVYWYLLASKGWSVLALNPVGSSSYGRNFSSRGRKRWGQCDLDQQMAAVDALRNEGLADERLAITGKSYGGYLSAWAIGNTTAFRAAIVSAPVTSIENHYGVSDSGYYADAYSMYGELSVKRDEMRELSPLSYVERVVTPTLILQGEADQRCPVCQAEELYTGIMTQTSTPVEMIIYPGGSHHFFEKGKPSHRKDMLERMLQWLCRWIEQPGADSNQSMEKGMDRPR
ncbi:prolyl oligopeptidase family serine peptidase [Caballeronia sp. RCC_10]|jgi:dipeptidyl aminopeptidase/acylaminoacyl peptidase|uniref:S9 family peptidase n=1 Tax=Caballeronia sp. RCC_10 TaxID=3239227 RepID=UPI003523BEAC